MIFTLSDLEMNESLKTRVSFEVLNGTWASLLDFLFASKALIHSLSASKLLFISAPSALLCLSLL